MGPVDVSPKVMTLLMVVQGQRVLLGQKKRGFGEGLWNGFGGKADENESVDEAALRELREEAGIEAVDATRRGLLTFVYDDQSRPMEVHVYHASRFTGAPVETEEMRPAWWEVKDLPWSQMWPDDEIWYPLFLSDRRFAGTVHFTNTTTIVKHDVREVAADTLAEMVRVRIATRRS